MSWALLGTCLFAATAVAALIAFALGLRGRRVDDHPLCRRCGYDLTGRPDGSDRCPECGADLAAAKAVRVGHRRRRGGLVWLGGALGLLALAVGGMTAVTLAGLDWQSRLPLWWLLHEAGSADPAVRTAALNEIDSRYTLNRLTAAQAAALVTRALDVQADASTAWESTWGKWVEAEHAAGHLSAADWARYARQAVGPCVLEPRARVRRGDEVFYWVGAGLARVSANYAGPLYALHDSRDTVLSVDGQAIKDKHVGGWSSGTDHLTANGGGRSGTGVDISALLPTLADGPHTLALHRKVKIRSGPNDTDPIVATAEQDASGPFVLQAGSTVTFKPDDAAGPAVLTALRVQGLRLQPGGNGSIPYLHVDLQIDTVPMPVGLSHKIFLRANGREWPAGSVSCPAGHANSGYGTGGSGEGLPADLKTADLVFRPDASVAARSTDTFEAWDREFTIPNVAVKTGP